MVVGGVMVNCILEKITGAVMITRVGRQEHAAGKVLEDND